LLDGSNAIIDSSTAPVFTRTNPEPNETNYTLRLTVSDQDSGSRQQTLPVSVSNVAPRFGIALSSDPKVEGQLLTFTVSNLVEPGADALTYHWTAVGPVGEELSMSGETTDTAQFTPPDEGTYWITLVVDDQTVQATRTMELQIGNENPTVSAAGGSSSDSAAPLELTGSVADAGSGDELTGTVDLGDGVVLPLELKSGDFELDYQYRSSGTYNVKVSIRDLDGGVSEQLLTHHVDLDAPVADIPDLVTDDVSPPLSGSIDDGTATVYLTIGGQQYQAVNDGVGGWTLADNLISPALGSGKHLVRVLAVDQAGNETQVSGSVVVVLHHPTAILLDQQTIYENTGTSAADLLFGTLSAADQDVDDVHLYELIAGTGDDDNARFLINGDEIFLQQGEVLDFESQAFYSVRVRVSDAFGNTHEQILNLSVENVVEIVGSPIVGDGTAQRSRVESLTLEFDGQIEFAPGAFEVVERSTGTTVDVTATQSPGGNGQTIVTLGFSGVHTGAGGGLLDGNYELRVHGSRIDGWQGPDFIFGDEEIDAFYRYFGDSNGNRFVDPLDSLLFRRSLNKPSTDPAYDERFDSNNNGFVDPLDSLLFRRNLNKKLDFE
ncbi:MAG: PKD domain-containing protein, partial [bacterium]|nr:PKD domain-containing protein [bacterium]